MNNLWHSISNRWLYLAGALFASGLMGFGLFLQYVEHQDPCPLCMVQRVIFIAILALFALAALHGPQRAESAFMRHCLYCCRCWVWVSRLATSGYSTCLQTRFPLVGRGWITC